MRPETAPSLGGRRPGSYGARTSDYDGRSNDAVMIRPKGPIVAPRKASYFDRIEQGVGGNRPGSSRIPTRVVQSARPYKEGQPATANPATYGGDVPHTNTAVDLSREASPTKHRPITAPNHDTNHVYTHDVGCQAAPLPWHRFFFQERVGQESNAATPNPFFNHFDVLLDDPLVKSSASYVVTNDVPPWMFDNYQRIYYSNGGENLQAASQGVSRGGWAELMREHPGAPDARDVTQGNVCIMAEGNETVRMDLAAFCEYATRLYPRSRQDAEPVTTLLRGVVKYLLGQLDKVKETAGAEADARLAGVLRARDEEIKRLEAAALEEGARTDAGLKDLAEQLARAREEGAQMRRELDGAQNAIAEKRKLNAEIDRLKADALKTRKETDALKSELSKLKTERAEDKAAITRIETAKIRAEGKLAQVQKQRTEGEERADQAAAGAVSDALQHMVDALSAASLRGAVGEERSKAIAGELETVRQLAVKAGTGAEAVAAVRTGAATLWTAVRDSMMGRLQEAGVVVH